MPELVEKTPQPSSRHASPVATAMTTYVVLRDLVCFRLLCNHYPETYGLGPDMQGNMEPIFEHLAQARRELHDHNHHAILQFGVMLEAQKINLLNELIKECVEKLTRVVKFVADAQDNELDNTRIALLGCRLVMKLVPMDSDFEETDPNALRDSIRYHEDEEAASRLLLMQRVEQIDHICKLTTAILEDIELIGPGIMHLGVVALEHSLANRRERGTA